MADKAWFADLDDRSRTIERIIDGQANTPDEWPARALEENRFTTREEYYQQLNEVAIEAVERQLVRITHEADTELVATIRTHDSLLELRNELEQLLVEAAETTGARMRPDANKDEIRAMLTESGTPFGDRLNELFDLEENLEQEQTQLAQLARQQIHTVAPNLATLAGELLAARLIAEAGSLGDLARMPSSTIQVLGAEQALFAHLSGSAPSPKHGLIFLHPAVRSVRSDNRGRAARILAGKLAIGARIDHYRGEIEPTLQAELSKRLQRLQEADQ